MGQAQSAMTARIANNRSSQNNRSKVHTRGYSVGGIGVQSMVPMSNDQEDPFPPKPENYDEVNRRSSAPQNHVETKVDLVDSVNLTGPNDKQIDNNEQELQ